MKYIRNTGILFSRDKGKKIIMYETIDEIKEAFPDIDESHLTALKVVQNNIKYGVLGFVHAWNSQPSFNPLFIHVSENDKFKELKGLKLSRIFA